MPEYLSPGVYVEEIDRGPRPIEGVGTAMAAFVGFTEKAQVVEQIDGEWITQDLINRPQLVTNWSQYVERFGEFVDGAYLPHAVYGYFMNGGGRCYVLSVRTIPRATAPLLNGDGKPQLIAQAKQAGFDGLRLRVKIETQNGASTSSSSATSASASSSSTTSSSASSKKSTADKADDEKDGDKKDDGKEATPPPPPPARASSGSNDQGFTMMVERETSTGSWQLREKLENIKLVEEADEDGNKQVKVAYHNNRGSRWIDLVVPETKATLAKLWPREQQQSLQIESAQLPAPAYDEFQGEITERTGMEGLQAIEDITMVCTPDLMTTMPGQKLDLDLVKAVQTLMIAHCEQMGDRVAILDSPPNMKPQQINKWRMDTAGYDSSYAALYYPWIQVQDPIQNKPTLIPPCGHMAGIWARNDNTRGVHKAPANEVVQGATGLAYNTTKGEQDVLNPNAVNCIRAFPGRGIRVWGARTLSSNPSWRYINVRRLFNYVEKSIERGTQWVVFEPNDRALWARVRRDVTAFLRTVWADGALFGNSPSEAFYVKCDDELNPPESRDLGRLIVEIGLCPVKPAEFVIFRISQWAGPNAEL